MQEIVDALRTAGEEDAALLLALVTNHGWRHRLRDHEIAKRLGKDEAWVKTARQKLYDATLRLGLPTPPDLNLLQPRMSLTQLQPMTPLHKTRHQTR